MMPRYKAFKFLSTLQEKFLSMYSPHQIQNAVAYGLPFQEEIKRLMVLISSISPI